MVKVLKVPPTSTEGKEEFSPYEASGEGAFVDRHKEGKIRYAAKGAASEEDCPAVTLTSLIVKACKQVGDKPFLRVERPCPPLVKGQSPAPAMPLADWTTWTYQNMFDECQLAARGFMALGLESFDAVNIFGFNSPEWVMGEIAAIMAGGVAAGIYPTDTPAQVAFKGAHSAARVALCEGMAQAKIFLEAAKDLPRLLAVVVWDATIDESELEDVVVDGRTIRLVHWKGLKTLGQKMKQEHLQRRMDFQKPGHVCAYIYTSGTTGNPKAVMISHDNLVFEAGCVLRNMPVSYGKSEERIVSYLPLSHVAGMLVDIIAPVMTPILRGGYTCVHFARPYDLKVGSVGDRLRMVKPTLFLGVPRVWEKIAEKMKKIGAAVTGNKKKFSTWCKAKGLAHQRNTQLGGSGSTPFMYGLAEMMVLSKVKRALGLEKCKFGFTGAAPITLETLEYFGSLGININECYGMSECTGATTWSTDEAHVWSSCGWALNGQEVTIFNTEGKEMKPVPRAKNLLKPTEQEQGEICYRGRHIMLGYMANPDLGDEHVAEIQKKTDDSIDEQGWLHSGDKGCMDERGMIKITGRYKELIITAGGENIAPVPLEDHIKTLCPGISNIMMLGDKRKFNIALISLKSVGATGDAPGCDDLDGAALKVNPEVTTINGAASDPVWIKTITDVITATNKNGDVCPSNACKIQKFCILPFDFSVQTGELTPTFKLKRSVVMAKHLAMVDKVYECADAYTKYEPWPEHAFGDDEKARLSAAMEVEESRQRPESTIASEDIMNADDDSEKALEKVAAEAEPKAEEAKPTEQAKPTEEAKPEEAKPTEEPKPEEPKPEEAKPTEQAKPTEEAKPEEPKPEAEPKAEA